MKPNQDTSLVAPVLENTLDALFSMNQLTYLLEIENNDSTHFFVFSVALKNMVIYLTNDLTSLKGMDQDYELSVGDTENTTIEPLLCECCDFARCIKDTVTRSVDNLTIDDLIIIREFTEKMEVNLGKVKDHYTLNCVYDGFKEGPERQAIQEETKEARGDSLKLQDYESLCEERGDNLQSCIRTLEEIRAIADLLTVSAGSNDPLFFDDTLEHIGCLITDRVKSTLDEINTEPAVSLV